MGIAVLTFLGSLSADDTEEDKKAKLAEIPAQYVPNATHFSADLIRSLSFFDSIYKGLSTLFSELPPGSGALWQEAKDYREVRRI